MLNMTRRRLLGTAASGAALTLLHPFSARAQAGQAHLRLMETTDIHVHVWPYDYYADRPVDTFGLARTAAHIEGSAPRRPTPSSSTTATTSRATRWATTWPTSAA